jgi:hypothetical protein
VCVFVSGMGRDGAVVKVSAQQGGEKYMEVYDKILIIWKRHETLCVSPKATEIRQQVREYHKVRTHPSRVNRMGCTPATPLAYAHIGTDMPEHS